MRDQTEWVETVENGWNVVVRAGKDRIIEAVNNYKNPDVYPEFFGEGDAGRRILNVLLKEN